MSLPDLDKIAATPLQQRLIERVIKSMADDLYLWTSLSTGRGSGKTTLRALIAQAIIDDPRLDAPHESNLPDVYRGYEVKPR